jgi:hypothetical protein
MFGLTLCTFVACAKQEAPADQNQAHRTEVQAKSGLFEIDGISAPSDATKMGDYLKTLTSKMKTRNFAGGTAVPYSDVVMYSFVSCQANWDQHCSGEYDLTAPPGYQACKPVYVIASTNNSQGFSFTPNNWYSGDTENPPRFRGYHFHIEANGSGTFLNQWGSNITLNNVGVRVIDAKATDFDRYATGCDMPKQ